MSSTGRSDVRRERDDFPTPGWCVDRLLDRAPLPGGHWLEPSAGAGGIIKAVRAWCSRGNLLLQSNAHPSEWSAAELNETYRGDLAPIVSNLYVGDFLRAPCAFALGCDVAIGNPPYELAMEFVRAARRRARVVAFLLRTNFLGSEERQSFWQRDMPDIFQLPNRPTFTVTKMRDPRTGAWKTTSSDSCEYAWFVWPELAPGGERRAGRIEVLDTTPEKTRAEWRSRAPVVTVGCDAAAVGGAPP